MQEVRSVPFTYIHCISIAHFACKAVSNCRHLNLKRLKKHESQIKVINRQSLIFRFIL